MSINNTLNVFMCKIEYQTVTEDGFIDSYIHSTYITLH